MNPTSNKKDFEELTTNIRDLAYAYLEKYNPSRQQLKIYLLKNCPQCRFYKQQMHMR